MNTFHKMDGFTGRAQWIKLVGKVFAGHIFTRIGQPSVLGKLLVCIIQGLAILGAAVVNDVLVIILLAFMMSFLGTGVTDDSLVVCLSFAYFAALIGMAAIIGSFAAGLVLSQTPY